MKLLLWVVVIGIVAAAALALLPGLREAAWRRRRRGGGNRRHPGVDGSTLSAPGESRDPAYAGPGSAGRPLPTSPPIHPNEDFAMLRGDLKGIEARLETLAERVSEVQGDVRHLRMSSADPRTPAAALRPAGMESPRPAADPYADSSRRSFSDTVPPRPPSPTPPTVAIPEGAQRVAAQDDRIVPSPRHPAEAWLVVHASGEGDVYLDPGSPLSEQALNRYATFFRWERQVPGRPYAVEEPARVQWDDVRKAGAPLRPGRARPA